LSAGGFGAVHDHVPGLLDAHLHGVVAGIGIAVPKDEKVQRTFTLRIDGKTPPVFSEASST